MKVYYVLNINQGEYEYLEVEKPLTKKELKEMFENINYSIKVYTLCTNNGLKNCVYSKKVEYLQETPPLTPEEEEYIYRLHMYE